ncbi:hypothetical protein Golomagni_01400 [Golovinomyces magnicellulatus]|nr:hypothetical protein Golomagni_01400 [Golovinomyces magnicellulatus]
MSTLFRLYNSAKSLLSNNPKHEKRIDTLETNIEDIGIKTGIQTSNRLREMGEDSNGETPKSSRKASYNKKRLRSDPQDGKEMVTLSSSKKQKNLPLREKHIDNVQTPKSRLAVEIMVKSSQSGTERFVTPMKDFGHCERNGSTIKRFSRTSAAKKDFLNDISIENKKTPDSRAHHRRFGSEESETQTFATPMEQIPTIIQPSQQEVIESDDDAPEAVTIHQSEPIDELKIDDSARSIAAKKLASKMKNRQRQKKRRIQLNRQETTNSNPTYDSADSIVDEETTQEKNSTNLKEFPQNSSKISLDSKNRLPDLLPLDYLEDVEPLEVSNPSHELHARKMGNKIKFSDLVEKKVKDKRVGSTTFRVVKASNRSLAPKAVLNARRTKELWLQGRSGQRQESRRISFSRKFTRV